MQSEAESHAAVTGVGDWRLRVFCSVFLSRKNALFLGECSAFKPQAEVTLSGFLVAEWPFRLYSLALAKNADCAMFPSLN